MSDDKFSLIKTWDMICPPLYLAFSLYAFEKAQFDAALLCLAYGTFRIFFSVSPLGPRFKRSSPKPPDKAA